MTPEEIRLRRLAGHHLLQRTDTQTAVKDLCGVQAQFLSHGLHGLSIRCTQVCIDGLIKGWTNRGTMHVFSADDLPLFLHEGRRHFLRPVDTLESDAYITAQRKAYFADLILDGIGRGIDLREDLKILCETAGMTEAESKSLFDPWGGTIRALCESGKICHKVQEKKAYRLCPAFRPMEEIPAGTELVRRYFTHFGPASVKDAACFFGTTQANIKTWMAPLPLEETERNGKPCFYGNRPAPCASVPDCLFLAGFDHLMLGYEKTENPFLPQAYMREIFLSSGIVRPVILVCGTAVGWWNLKNKTLTVNLFTDADRDLIAGAACCQWPQLRHIHFPKRTS